MSVYRVVRNYYYDLLRFLQEGERQYNGNLGEYFAHISYIDKQTLVNKLAEMMVRIDTAFDNEKQYWSSMNMEQSWYALSYVLMLMISLIVLVYMFLLRFKEISTFGNPCNASGMVVKSLLTYVIVYQVILSVFVVFLINVSYQKKLCKGQVKVLKDVDVILYSNFVFTNSLRPGSYDWNSLFFKYYGYYKHNNTSKCKQLRPTLMRDNRAGVMDLLPLDNANKSSGNDMVSSANPFATDKPVQAGALQNSNVEIIIYDRLRSTIETSMWRLYNYGNGFRDVKKALLMSSPILMLLETKNLMNYYYFVSQKKTSAATEQEHSSEKDVIQQKVVTPIVNLINDVSDISENDDAIIARQAMKNEKNEDFTESMEILLQAFGYLSIFGYPIFVKKSDKETDFPLPAILDKFPTKIDTSQMAAGRTKAYMETIKSSFVMVYGSEFQKLLNKSADATDAMVPVKDLFANMIPLFNKLYAEVYTNVHGGAQFPFNRKYIVNKMLTHMATDKEGCALLPDNYRRQVVEAIYTTIISPVSGTFDILAVRKGALVDGMAKDLIVHKDINVLKYQNYVITAIISTNKNAQTYIDSIVEILNSVHKNLLIMRQVQYGDDLSVESTSFMSQDEFDALIDNIPIRQFVVGLDTAYFKDIIEKFYMSISEAVNSRSHNLSNIFYQKQKSFAIWKAILIMGIIFIILIAFRSMYGTMEKRKTLKMATSLRDCDTPYLKKDFFSRKFSWIILLIIPIVLSIFLISMMLSFYKKMRSKHDFNVDIIENNTSELRNALDDFYKYQVNVWNKCTSVEREMKIGSVAAITKEDKRVMFEFIRKIVDKYEKCNYILESAKAKLPFPYSEVVVNGVMLLVCVVTMLYVWMTFAPLKRIADIRYLNLLKAQLEVTDNLTSFGEKLRSLAICHFDEVDGVSLSFKVMFFTSIVIFMLIYSGKIVSTSNDFKLGLYNSMYYEQSRCFDQ